MARTWSTLHRATDDELTLLTLLADSTALALLNVQLYADTRTAVEHEREARDAAERARFEAEQAAAAKDESLALVAHELRQPLHASMAAVRMMALNKDRPDDAERARAVVERQIQAMSAIVEDLLDAARIVRGDIKLDPQPIDVRAIVQQVGDMVQPLMVERQHDFVVTLIDTPVMVSADPGRVQQVLMNLLTNAIKYTDPGRVHPALAHHHVLRRRHQRG